MFDFPNAPSNGQQVQGSAGQIYAWDGVKWKAQMPPGPLAVNQGGTGVNNVAAAPWVELTGDAMTGLLTLSGDPTAPLHAATRQYVDSKSISFPVTVPQGGTGAVTLPVTIPGGPGPPALTGAFLLGNGTNPVAPDTTTTSTIGGITYPGANIHMVSAVNGATNIFQMWRSAGTLAAPTPIVNGIPLGTFQWGGYDGTWWYPGMAQISVSPTEDWSGTKHGTSMSLYITKTGSNNTFAGMTIDGTGRVTMSDKMTVVGDAPTMMVRAGSGNYAGIMLRRNNGNADQHDWEILEGNDGTFEIRTINDAYSAANSALRAVRAASGVGVAEIVSDAPKFSIGGGASAGFNGYVKLFNGLILQWGYSGGAGGGQGVTITLPIPFPNALLSVTANLDGDPGPGNSLSCTVASINASSFAAYPRYSNSGGYVGNATQGIHWMAVGY